MLEVISPPTVNPAVVNGTRRLPDVNSESAIALFKDGGPHKIVLPRRLGEPRFAPQPYYYQASRSGVLPSWYSAGLGRPS
jgi:hypothetical protein